jgi:hypothetical protein
MGARSTIEIITVKIKTGSLRGNAIDTIINNNMEYKFTLNLYSLSMKLIKTSSK